MNIAASHGSTAQNSPPEVQAQVVVIGSANLDLVVSVPHHPKGGETLLGGELTRHPGGKGANQAVASARAGAVPTAFIGAVGRDDAAGVLLNSLHSAGVNTQYIKHVDQATGTALISVDEKSENAIIVAPGANNEVAIGEAETALISKASVVLSQLEIPVEIVIEAARSRRPAAIFILNAAPSRPLPDELWEQIDVLIVNEHEAADLARSDSDAYLSPQELAAALLTRVPAVVITLGSKGCLVAERNSTELSASKPNNPKMTEQPAFTVESVDTTGAGDTFCGVLAAAIAAAPEATLAEVTQIASAAGALATTRRGAQTGVPTYDEVIALVATIS